MGRFAKGFFGSFILLFSAMWCWLLQTDPIWLEDYEAMTLSKSELVRQCNLGTLSIFGDSSAAYALRPSILGSSVVNLAQGSGTPVTSYFLAKKAMACPNLPQSVILSYNPRTMMMARPFLEMYIQHYGNYSWSDFDEFRAYMRDARLEYYPKTYPYDVDIMLLEWAYANKFPPYYLKETKDVFINGHNSRPALKKAYVKRGEMEYIPSGGSQELDQLVTYDQFVPQTLNDYYLRKMIGLFAEKKIDIYLVITPFSDITIDKVKPDVIKAYQAYLQELVQQYPNVHLLTPQMTALSWRYFGDSRHLKARGGRYFSEMIVKRLQEQNVRGWSSPARAGETRNPVQ